MSDQQIEQMNIEMKIHGVPNPPLGYRLAVKGDKRCEGIRIWDSHGRDWENSHNPLIEPLKPDRLYAVPLNDGYDYFEAGTTVIQAGDEGLYACLNDVWTGIDTCFLGQTTPVPLRCPKAKPPVEERVKVSWRIGRNPANSTDYLLSQAQADAVTQLLEAMAQ